MNQEDTPKEGETVIVDGTPKNDAPKVTEISPQEIEELRKAKLQAEMRANQLENEKKDREKLDEEARQKQLEEQNEFKTLYEREKEARERLEQEQIENELKATLAKSKSDILSSYSADVVELAETTGLNLLDDSDEAKELFKSKLDKIASKFTNEQPKKVVGNNGKVDTTPDDRSKELIGQMRYADTNTARKAREEAISKIPALDAMRAIAGVKKV